MMIKYAFAALLLMGAAIALPEAGHANDINKVRTEILQNRYNAELKNAKTAGQKSAVITKYGEQLNGSGKPNYGAMPASQRYKYGTGAVSAATAGSEGSSSYAQGRKKAQQEQSAQPLNYYDLPGQSEKTTTGGQGNLLPPR